MHSLNDLIGRTVNIDIEGLNEESEPVEMAFIITDVHLNDYHFTEKPFEEIYIEISAVPVDYKTWDKDLKEWWTEIYSDHYFTLNQLK
ncbi:MAG: hypothetical protein JKY22_08960 [Flavobacteriaceae bacterium]|nr:hypothetical protein [Flavobacteriaceae bacterium]